KNPAERYEKPGDVARDLLPFFADAPATAARPATEPTEAAAPPAGRESMTPADTRQVKAFQPGTLPPPSRLSHAESEVRGDTADDESGTAVVTPAASKRSAAIVAMGIVFAAMITVVVVLWAILHKPPPGQDKLPTQPSTATGKRGTEDGPKPPAGSLSSA